MAEDVGIGGRAGFYDAAGAARDVLQNHLLQLLALVAMEEPVSFGAEALRREKIKALGAISLPDNLERYAVRGQYDVGWLGGERVVGYTDEKGVPADSRTETYAAVRLGVETRRWAGVPFYLRTGKRLPKRVTEIAVIFKRAPHTPFSANDVEELGHNQLVIRVQPDEGVTLRFGSKVPGTTMEVRDVAMDFAYGASFTESSPGGLRAAGPRRHARRQDAVPQPRRGRDELAGHRPARGLLGLDHAGEVRRRHVGSGQGRRDAGRRRPQLASAMMTATRGDLR